MDVVAVAETRVEQLRDQLAQETGALRKMQERAEAAERELNLSKGTLNTVKMERAQLQGQVKDARETIKELQARVAAEQALVKDGLGREVGLKEVIAGLERQLAQSRAEMQATQASACGQRHRAPALAAPPRCLAWLSAPPTRSQEELEERTRELEEEKKGRAEDVERLYAAKVAVGDELEATSKALAEEKAGRGADVEERDQEIGRLLGLVQSLRDEVEAKTQTITYKEKRIAELHERIEKQNGALEDLRERLDEEVERNRQLNESKVYFESQVASIKAANAQLNDRHVTDEEEIKRLNQMLVEEGKVHESTVQERDRVVARAKVEVERAYRVRMLEQETRWLGSMQQAVDDLHDRESGYEALQRVFKSVELSLGDVEPLLENLKGSE